MNTLLKHKFFLYGMIVLSVMQLLNFYRSRSLSCLGTFGVAYYLGCMMTKNKALCLLFAVLVSTIVMGCEGRFVTFYEGMDHACSEQQDEDSCNSRSECIYEAGDAAASPPVDAVCRDKVCSDHTTESDCASPCNWENGACIESP